MPPNFKHHFQDALLRIPLRSLILPLRGYHPLRHAFPGDFALPSEEVLIKESLCRHSTLLTSFNVSFGLPYEVFGRSY